MQLEMGRLKFTLGACGWNWKTRTRIIIFMPVDGSEIVAIIAKFIIQSTLDYVYHDFISATTPIWLLPPGRHHSTNLCVCQAADFS
jgi:hypothetical protein